MTAENTGKNTSDNKQAAEHVTEAHTLLQELRREVNQHPKLEDAILKLEMALSLLTTKSGGMLQETFRRHLDHVRFVRTSANRAMLSSSFKR